MPRMHLDRELSSDTILVILGPTASGKTRLAVEVAKRLNGEIVSVDSRQVYRGMDIGTGKDLEEYGNGPAAIKHHLIDLLPAGDKYNVRLFVDDVDRLYPQILKRGKVPILCGGTGMYLDALLRGHELLTVPVDLALRSVLEEKNREELLSIWQEMPTELHPTADILTNKRLIRAIEVLRYKLSRSPEEQDAKPRRIYKALLYGLDPAVEVRRSRISERLYKRLKNGLVEEVEGLMQQGISAEDLIYYGLEYKFITRYLLGELDYATMTSRLETEIHRFAKRQMTFFRKMEKDGLQINWLPEHLSGDEKASLIAEEFRENQLYIKSNNFFK